MTDLRDNYHYYRARAYRAKDALERARADLSKGKKRYGACSRAIYYERRDDKGEGFLSNAHGTLRVTYCDEAKDTRIDHKGWFIDPDQDGTMRGVVVQLSHNRYFPGYESSNDDAGILVDWSDCRDNMRDAAHAADSFAESRAEKEREYQTAWSAGSLFASLGEDVRLERQSILKLCAEYRQARTLPGADEMKAICATIKMRVSRGLRKIAKARENREKLREGDYGELCFYPSERLMEAFRDGACL